MTQTTMRVLSAGSELVDTHGVHVPAHFALNRAGYTSVTHGI